MKFEMRARLVLWAASAVMSFSALSAAEAKLGGDLIRLERSEDRVRVHARLQGSETWTDLLTCVTRKDLRPYLHPVFDATGRHVLTEDKPADHPWQHGIFTGFHRVNGFNYWKEDEGRQRFVRLIEASDEQDRIRLKTLTELVSPTGEVVLEEEDTIVIHAPRSRDFYLIDFTLLLRAKQKDVSFGKFFVGGLSVRMPWDQANPRQTHLNSEGLTGRAAEQQRAAWCTVERPFGEEVFGFVIFDHPKNANHPPAWRADEQGLINPNVSGVTDWSIPAGEHRQFQYRILVYKGRATKETMAARFDEFRK